MRRWARHDCDHRHPQLTDLLPAPGDDDPDLVYEAFSTWVTSRGIELYAAQQEALIEVVAGSNVVLATPTGSGKSLVAAGAHAAALSAGIRSFYTAPLKALVSEKFFSSSRSSAPNASG